MDQTDKLIVDRIKGVVGNSSLLKEKFKKEILDKKFIDSKQINQQKTNLEKSIKGLDQQLKTNLESISQVEVNHMLKKIETKRYKVISKLLEEELVNLEDKKNSLIQEIDDLDNQKEWVEWISKYGDDISKRFNKPTSDLIQGLVDKIIVSPVMGETRDGKETQRGHIFKIKFKLPIVNDGIKYKDQKNKSNGYSIVDGDKETIVDQGLNFRGEGKKKFTKFDVHTKLLNSNRKFLYVHQIYPTSPFLEFSIEFQSNNLIYDKGYTIRQQMIYSLIRFMKDEGLGYRKISKKLNQWGIKTHRGKQWFNTSVSSVLKRKHERDVMINEIRDHHYPSKVSKMELKYYTFD